MKIHIRVQHSAGRGAALARLLALLPPAVEVITDEQAYTIPNPMRNYLRCMTDPPKKATHLLIIQDDALPCRLFSSRLHAAVSERPDDVLSLFVGGLSGKTKKSFLEALANHQRWAPIWFREIHHVVAMCWPVEKAAHFVDWYAVTKVPGPIPPKSDDAVVGFWARKNREQVWAHVPCLVEHPDDLPSIVQSRSRFSDAGRRAIAFADDLT